MFISILIDGNPLIQNEKVDNIEVENLLNPIYGLEYSNIKWEKIVIKISNYELKLPKLKEKSIDQPLF
jgi:hypothetical protein